MGERKLRHRRVVFGWRSGLAGGVPTRVRCRVRGPAGRRLIAKPRPRLPIAAAAGHGAMKVDPAHPHHYLYADGTRPFQMGYELDWLGMMDFGNLGIPKAKSVVDMLAANGFSEVLLNAYAYDTSWKTGHTSTFDFGPPALIPWARQLRRRAALRCAGRAGR